MVVAFANNQAMTAKQGTVSVIYTDPMALNGNDRAAANLGVHYIWGQTAGSSIAYDAEVSNDGVNWVPVSAFTDTTTAPTGITPRQVVATVNGAFIRFKFSLTAGGSSGELAGVAFDLHVKLDHA